MDKLILSLGEPSGVGADGTGVHRACPSEGSTGIDAGRCASPGSFERLGSWTAGGADGTCREIDCVCSRRQV